MEMMNAEWHWNKCIIPRSSFLLIPITIVVLAAIDMAARLVLLAMDSSALPPCNLTIGFGFFFLLLYLVLFAFKPKRLSIRQLA